LPYLEDKGNIAGAYVSCLIKVSSVTKADEIAKDEIDLAK